MSKSEYEVKEKKYMCKTQGARIGPCTAGGRFSCLLCVSDSIQQLGCHSSRLSTCGFLSLQDRKEAQGLPEEDEHVNVWPFRRTVEGL